MRITLVHASYYYSGSEKSVELLARWLLDNGYEVRIVSAGNYKAPTDLKDIEINVLPHKSTALQLHALLSLARFMKHNEDNTDIYHIYNVFPLPAAGLYKLLGGKRPVIATLNNYAGFCPTASAIYDECSKLSCRIKCLNDSISFKQKNINTTFIYAYCVAYTLLINLSKRADKYIAISNKVKDIYVKYGYDDTKIIVIPEFMYLKRSNISNLKDGVPSVPIKLLYVGTLNVHKGVDLLIKALNILRKQYNYDCIYLTIVGTGDQNYEDYCKTLVDEFNLGSFVKFLGRVSEHDLNILYSNHDIFIHPARWYEPFGRTIIEALSHGLPCIVSDTVSKDVIGDAGLLFKHDNVEDLVDKIVILLNNVELYKLLSKNALKYINRFDINHVGNEIIKLYADILNHHNQK